MSIVTRDAPGYIRRTLPTTAREEPAPTVAAAATDPRGWRGDLALREADRIRARQNVTPELEPESPSLQSDDNFDDDDNEDVTPDLEPFDPCIESSASGKERVIVEGDEDEVVITAEEGEVLVIDETADEVTVAVEDDDAA